MNDLVYCDMLCTLRLVQKYYGDFGDVLFLNYYHTNIEILFTTPSRSLIRHAIFSQDWVTTTGRLLGPVTVVCV